MEQLNYTKRRNIYRLKKYVAVCMCGSLYANNNTLADNIRYKVRARLVCRLFYLHLGPRHSISYPRYKPQFLARKISTSPAECGAPGGRADPLEAIATETCYRNVNRARSFLFGIFPPTICFPRDCQLQCCCHLVAILLVS